MRPAADALPVVGRSGQPARNRRIQLVGRDAELAVLADAVATAGSGAPAVLVRGDAGVGISALLRVSAERARRAPCTVLTVAGLAGEEGLPFAALHRLLRSQLFRLPNLRADQQDALGRAVGLRPGPAPGPASMAAATLALLSRVPDRRPVVIVVDDLHRLDADSAAVLGHLARAAAEVPVLVIAGGRVEDATDDDIGRVDPSDRDLRQGFRRRLTLAALDDVAARELLRDLDPQLGTDATDWVLALAAGFPLALVELAAVAPARDDLRWLGTAPPPVPPRLVQAFAGRLTELPPDTRSALLVAAIGQHPSLVHIAAAAAVLCGRAVPETVLDPAVAQRLLRVERGAVVFTHPVARMAVADQESVVRRQAAHAAWTATLPATHDRLRHRVGAAAGPDAELAAELERAGGEEARAGRLPQAIVMLQQSADLSGTAASRVRRLLLGAELAVATGRRRLARRLAAEAAAIGITGVDEVRSELLREAPLSAVSGDRSRIVELCLLADRAADDGDRDLSLKGLVAAAQRCWWASPTAADRDRVAAAALLAHRDAPDARCVAAVAMADPVGRGRPVLAMLGDMHRVDDPLSLRWLGLAAHAVGDEVLATVLSRRAEEPLRARGLVGALGHALGVSAAAALDLGEWAGVAEASAEGSALAREAGQLIGSAGAHVTQARLLALQGDTAAALDLVTHVEHDPLLRRLPNFRCRAQIVRGIAFISAGRNEDACAALEKVFDRREVSHHPREQMGGLMYLAEAAAACSRQSGVHGILADMEQLAALTGSPLLTTHLLYARPVLAGDHEAEPLYEQAVGADLSAWPWTRGRVLLAYGGWLRRRRRTTASRSPLREALAVFDRLGAEAWADRARGELEATGEARPAVPQPALSALSAQELQIAQLVAKGLTNAEIGQQLHLSRRTVGSHLYRIFPKLDITSRGQVAGLLRSPAPGSPAGGTGR